MHIDLAKILQHRLSENQAELAELKQRTVALETRVTTLEAALQFTLAESQEAS